MGSLPPSGTSDPLPAAAVLEALALRLQAEAGCAVSFSRTAPTADPAVWRIVVEYSEEAAGRLALDLALELYAAVRDGTAFDTHAAIARLRDLDEDIRPGPSTRAILEAARARRIPWRRLTHGSLVQLGWGSRQRRFQAAEVDATSAVAESIAQDKALTKSLLESAGVPIPRGLAVTDFDGALAAARTLGYPVVVKPRHGNHGRGVTTGIRTDDQLHDAVQSALAHEPDLIVERYIPGSDHRLLVVGDAVVAGARREPPHVTGDGARTIRALVDDVNADPRRGDGHATPLTRIPLDEIALAHLRDQGWTPESVPPAGARITLRNNANLSTGGSAADVTDDVHPQFARTVVAAARAIGLDVCGVDVLCESVRVPLESQGGAVIEVNAAPGLRMHLTPSHGQGRDVGTPIVGLLYPPGQDGRIPVVAVTGTNGKTTTTRLVAAMLAAGGLRVGVTGTEGVFVDGTRIDSGDCSGPVSARNVLVHPDVDAAVFETARGGILREGLGFDQCAVAVVTNIGQGDHLGLGFVETADELAAVKQVIVRNVAPDGTAVLNAADPRVAAMSHACPGRVLYFARDGRHPVVAGHRARGGRAVFVDRDAVVAEASRTEQWRLPLAAIPLTAGGRIAFQVENVLAAVGAAWCAGADWTAIESALRDFESDAGTVPGRFNLFRHRGAHVIADYGHNPDALLALIQALEAFPHTRRTLVLSAAGDRRDEDIREQGRIVGHAFDRVILYQDAAQRGRADGEVISLLRDGLRGATRAREIEAIHGEFRAIDVALSALDADDLCLVLVDQVDEALAHLASRVSGGA